MDAGAIQADRNSVELAATACQVVGFPWEAARRPGVLGPTRRDLDRARLLKFPAKDCASNRCQNFALGEGTKIKFT